MAIDKELFYASQGLIYPVVARPYTDDMVVKEKFFTKDEVVAMLTELKLEIEELQGKYSPYYDEASQHTCEIIQQKIDKMKGE